VWIKVSNIVRNVVNKMFFVFRWKVYQPHWLWIDLLDRLNQRKLFCCFWIAFFITSHRTTLYRRMQIYLVKKCNTKKVFRRTNNAGVPIRQYWLTFSLFNRITAEVYIQFFSCLLRPCFYITIYISLTVFHPDWSIHELFP